ncbi:MAG: hypothetical protein V4726_11415 [Verrucomicrobiota bacterium]
MSPFPDTPPPPADASPSELKTGTGSRGPLLVLGGILLSAGLIVHFSPSGNNSRNAAASSGTSAQNGADQEFPGAGAPGSGRSGKNSDGTPSGISKAFLASPHYKAALDVAGMADGLTRSEAMEALIETWVATSPVDAADWAGSLPAGNFRDDAMSALMFHWGLAAPAGAAAWMARTGVDDPEAASALAGRWAVTDAASAAIWSEGLPDPVMRHNAIAGVAGAWAEHSPEAAAAWVTGLPAADKAAAATTLAAAWAQAAPAAAAAWLARQKDAGQESQAGALAVLTTLWAEQSPGAASKFLNSLPEGPARDAATSQFAVAAAPTAPAEALTWAMNLTDPVQRNQVVADAAESWYDGAPEGFHAGISDALALMDDATMRKGVYEMLYDRDPGFHDNLLKMIEPAAPVSTPAPATPPAGSASGNEPAAVPPAAASSVGEDPAIFSPVPPASPPQEPPAAQENVSAPETEPDPAGEGAPSGPDDQEPVQDPN